MTAETKKSFYVTGAVTAVIVLLCCLLTGCGTVTCTQSLSLASAIWRAGSGVFSLFKSGGDEKTPQMESKSKFVVGKQTTGYDVELSRDKKFE